MKPTWLLWPIGIAAGIGGSVVWPLGFAPELPAAEVAAPQPGQLLQAGDQHAIVVAETIQRFGPGAIATVIFLRGPRTGRHTAHVACKGLQLVLDGQLLDWAPGGPTLEAKIGAALCPSKPRTEERT